MKRSSLLALKYALIALVIGPVAIGLMRKLVVFVNKDTGVSLAALPQLLIFVGATFAAVFLVFLALLLALHAVRRVLKPTASPKPDPEPVANQPRRGGQHKDREQSPEGMKLPPEPEEDDLRRTVPSAKAGRRRIEKAQREKRPQISAELSAQAETARMFGLPEERAYRKTADDAKALLAS
ncbi:MAG: hypothetical protein HYY24_06195 [Verrucomicrobia bacterium]|nr:hypothetical protein [Verrucomicrobiota bacterium]